MERLGKPVWLRRARQYVRGWRNRKKLMLHLTDRFVRVTAYSGKKGGNKEKLLYECAFPPVFCSYHFYQHPEEMAGWLKPHLQDAGIRLARFCFVLDSGQVYLQKLTLPVMGVREQESWLQWEASRFIPFPAGSFTVRLTPEGTEPEARGQQLCLLAALRREHIEALQRIAGELPGRLCQITVAGQDGAGRDIDFLPQRMGPGKLKGKVYRGVALLLLASAGLLASASLIQWWLMEAELRQIQDRLLPLTQVREEYRQFREAEASCRKYEALTRRVVRKRTNWPRILTLLGTSVSPGCWLEEIRQKPDTGDLLEIRGRALHLTELLQFKEALGRSGCFQKILLTESSSLVKERISRAIPGAEAASQGTIGFVLLAQEANGEK